MYPVSVTAVRHMADSHARPKEYYRSARRPETGFFQQAEIADTSVLVHWPISLSAIQADFFSASISKGTGCEISL